MNAIEHLESFVSLFFAHAAGDVTFRGIRRGAYDAHFSAVRGEIGRMNLRENECPLIADYTVRKAALRHVALVGDTWVDETLVATYFRKSAAKNVRNFNGPQPSRAFFRVFATPRFNPERNRTILLRPREALFFLAQYRDQPPFADGRSLRFPSTTEDGRTIRYVAPHEERRNEWTTAPVKATLAFVEPNVPLAENESWLLVNHVICL